MFFRIWMAVALIELGMSGCASLNDTLAGDPWRAYAGSSLPREQVAVVKASLMRNFFSEAYVLQVNDKPVDRLGAPVEMLPGKHILKVGVSQRIGGPGSLLGAATQKNAQGNIEVDAQAGHIYVVDGTIVDGKAVLWVEDEQLQQVVAGNKP